VRKAHAEVAVDVLSRPGEAVLGLLRRVGRAGAAAQLLERPLQTAARDVELLAPGVQVVDRLRERRERGRQRISLDLPRLRDERLHALPAGLLGELRLDHPQLLALIAPRAFLLMAGDAEDHDASRAFVEAVRPVYRLFGAEQNLGWFNHHAGHRYPPPARSMAEAFLDAQLKR